MLTLNSFPATPSRPFLITTAATSTSVVSSSPLAVLESPTNEEAPEELVKVRVVRLVAEAKGMSVVQEDAKLVGEAATESSSQAWRRSEERESQKMPNSGSCDREDQ